MQKLISLLKKTGTKNVSKIIRNNEPVKFGNCHCQGGSSGNCGPGVCR